MKGEVYYNKVTSEHVLCFGFRSWAAQGYVIEEWPTEIEGEAWNSCLVLVIVP